MPLQAPQYVPMPQGPYSWKGGKNLEQWDVLQGPLPLMTVGSGRPNAWEAEAALGGVKLFLIGSPYASDFCFSDIAGGPLQVRQTLSSVTSTLTEILGVSLSVHWLCLLYWRLSTS